jgi:hypothetical protein
MTKAINTAFSQEDVMAYFESIINDPSYDELEMINRDKRLTTADFTSAFSVVKIYGYPYAENRPELDFNEELIAIYNSNKIHPLFKQSFQHDITFAKEAYRCCILRLKENQNISFKEVLKDFDPNPDIEYDLLNEGYSEEEILEIKSIID